MGDLPPWDPDAEDRRILRERTAHRRSIQPQAPANKGEGTTQSYTDRRAPRGVLTDAELERRKQAERAMRIRARNQRAAAAPRRRRALPEPRPKPNGRWEARVIHRGRAYIKTFDTQAEARAFIRQVTNQQPEEGDD